MPDLDIHKAFDSLAYGFRLAEFHTFELTENALRWIEAILSHISSIVRIGAALTSSADALSGVPQCSMFGPFQLEFHVGACTDDASSCLKPAVSRISKWTWTTFGHRQRK